MQQSNEKKMRDIIRTNYTFHMLWHIGGCTYGYVQIKYIPELDIK